MTENAAWLLEQLRRTQRWEEAERHNRLEASHHSCELDQWWKWAIVTLGIYAIFVRKPIANYVRVERPRIVLFEALERLTIDEWREAQHELEELGYTRTVATPTLVSFGSLVEEEAVN